MRHHVPISLRLANDPDQLFLAVFLFFHEPLQGLGLPSGFLIFSSSLLCA
jgi:hypothetical protein